MAGLFAFFYGTLHLLIYVDRSIASPALDFSEPASSRVQNADANARACSIGAGHLQAAVHHHRLQRRGCRCCRWRSRRRPGWIRRLGGKRWNALHRLVYLTGIARRRCTTGGW